MRPLSAPDHFFSGMPFINFSISGNNVILIQPGSTILVYLLGLIMIAIGIYFLVTKKEQQSRYYWAIGLIIWGISAIVAGTSYQAFGYELNILHYKKHKDKLNLKLIYIWIGFLIVNIGYIVFFCWGYWKKSPQELWRMVQ